MRILLAVAAVVAAAACTEPMPQPEPEEMERVVNATRVDPGVAPGSLGNESANYAEGPVTPAEREPIRQVESQSPAQVVGQFANLLVRRQFDEAYRMWDPQAADFTPEQLAGVFASFETIAAEIGQTATPAGAPASAEQVQLTLSGTTTAGEKYTITGPVTVTRAGGQQNGWKIAKMVLTANPRAAEALVEQ